MDELKMGEHEKQLEAGEVQYIIQEIDIHIDNNTYSDKTCESPEIL